MTNASAAIDPRPHRAIGIALWSVLGVIFLILILQINRRISSGHSGDFRHFYFASGALLDHRDLYGPAPMDVVERGLGRPAGPDEKKWYTTDGERYLYPPLIAMLYTPIARLRFDIAQRIILLVNAMLVMVVICLTARLFIERFDLKDRGWLIPAAALLGTLLNLDKLHVELQMFQTNSLMFCMFALSLYWLDRRPILAGVPLGVIFNIKYLSLGLLPWLLIRRRWGSAASCVLSTIAFALLPALISGWHANLSNLGVAYGGLLHMIGVHSGVEQANVEDIRDLLSCSITSAMARTTKPGESLVLPMIYSACIAGISVLIVIWMYRRKRVPIFAWPRFAPSLSAAGFSPRSVGTSSAVQLPDDPRPEGRRLTKNESDQPWKAVMGVEFVSIIAATLCFSPQTNTRHLMLVLLLTIPISSLILRGRAGVSRVAVIIAALLIGVGFIFPPGGQAPESHHLAMQWFRIGGQCWCLLIAMLLLVWSALTNAASPSRVFPLNRGDAEKKEI